jgi:hypothetical protein
LALLAALAMLAVGGTVLKGRLGPVAFLLYWLVCLCFTSLAMVVAFLDMRALRRRLLEERRVLFQATLEKIESDAKSKPRRPPTDRSFSA